MTMSKLENTVDVRNKTLDIMKGLGMLFIIMDHCEPVPIEIRHITMSFLMPMFFMVGGYMYKPRTDLLADASKAARRLLLPYLAGGIILCLQAIYVAGFSYGRALEMLISGGGVPNYYCHWWSRWECIGAFWFFPAMFWCRVFFNTIFTRCGRWKYPVLILTSVAGYVLLRFVIRLPFGISEGLSVLMFYLLGHLFRLYRQYYAGQSATTQRWLHIASAVQLIIAIGCSYWCIRYSEIIVSAGYYAHHILNIVGACGSTYVFYLFCRAVGENMPRTAGLLCFAGYGSLFILWIHKISLHFVFAWPHIWNCCPETIDAAWAAAFLGLQWVFCLACLLIAGQSRTLRNFFGIYQPVNKD